ncbi:MAG: DUF6151 family protein [Litoreibacter sp.]
MTDVVLKCNCGTLEAVVTDVSPHHGTRVTCYCDDCRAGTRIMYPNDDCLDGVGIFQTDPDKLYIRAGHDQLANFSLSPRGLLRWYAKCCDTPMFNTMRSSRLPFVGVLLSANDDNSVFGPIRAQGFIKTADGKIQHKGMFLMVSRMFRRIIASLVTGRWRKTPFFDTRTNTPIQEPWLVRSDDKAKAYAR